MSGDKNITQCSYLVIDRVDVHLVLQLNAGVTMPALHQVDEVEHDDEGHWDVHVAVVTWTLSDTVRVVTETRV